MVVAILMLVVGAPAMAAAAAPARFAVVSPELLALDAGETTEFLVYLRARADLAGVATLADREARATTAFQRLTDTAKSSQTGVTRVLDSVKVSYRAFWIANAVWVKGGDKQLISVLGKRTDVKRIDPVTSVPLIEPKPAPTPSKTAAGPEWGIANIEAPRVWSEYGVRGQGVVVANIDTGVQYDHPALVGSYRGNVGNGQFDHNYNWFDPSHQCGNPSLAPCDQAGHGTHTMGTMVGDDGAGNQIGVAPGARWFAARGCETSSCSTTSLLASGQFVLAPTDLNGNNPRPELHADIVNNSWGGSHHDLWYQQMIKAWINAGIFPVFATGNSGPGCDTSESPGDNVEAYAAGAYDAGNAIADFSSRGPGVGGDIKPDIAAPGVNVRSSVPGGGYTAQNGTSMAAPHLAGTVALMWSAASLLKGNIEATRQLLDGTATDVNSIGCGGSVADNNVFGQGRLNAFKAVGESPRDPAGRVTGVVTNAATGAPLAGVRVSSGVASVPTGADGRYTMALSAGARTVTAVVYGFAARSAQVNVPQSGTVTQNFALTALPLVTVSGQVTDGSGKAYPVYAKIEIAGRPGGPVFTNPADGRYSVQLPANATHHLTITAQYGGYQKVEQDVAVGGTNKTHNVAIPIDAANCTARGYSFRTPVLDQAFTGSPTAPAGWQVVNRTSLGGWIFSDATNDTGGEGGFAALSLQTTSGSRDTDLITPAFSVTGMARPHLQFNTISNLLTGGTADADVSTDGGATWRNVWRLHPELVFDPLVVLVPLGGLTNPATVKVRFRYAGTNFNAQWQVDNVKVYDRVCEPRPGALVVGFVSDYNTGAAVNHATIVNPESPNNTATSAPTPEDPNIGDGFYSLYSPLLGSRQFTATRAPFERGTALLRPADNQTIHASFRLRVGRLSVSPPSISAELPAGGTRQVSVTVTNTGSQPANVDILEGTGLPLAGPPPIGGAWTHKAPLPAGFRVEGGAVALGGKIYAMDLRSKFISYDPASNTWTSLPNHPAAQHLAAVNGKIYLFGGAAVDVFDPATNAWTRLAGVANPKPHADSGVAVTRGKVFIIAGCNNGIRICYHDVVIFDSNTNTFSTGAPYPRAVGSPSCGAIGGKVYCAGDDRSAFVYDPRANQWTPIADMPLDLHRSAHSVAGGRLVIAGGSTPAGAITNRSFAYDPATDTWSDLPNTQVATYDSAGACGFYKIGGLVGFEEISPAVEHLGGLDQCEQEGDVRWLSTNPGSFTLQPGESRVVTVTLQATAASGVSQPGTYEAKLSFPANTPYGVPSIGVTMRVTPA